MMTRMDPEAPRLHNRRAVQRLFEERRRHGGGGGGAAPAPPSDRLSSSSAVTLSQLHAASTDATAGAGGYDPRRQQPWVTTSRRGCALEPSLDAASHLSQQLQLALELQPGGIDPAEYNALLSRATSVGGLRGSIGDPSNSCFALHVAKHQHRVALSSPASLDPAVAAGSRRERERAQLRQYHQQQAILRNEQALARKRAAHAYTSLTAAQADASAVFPNAHTLDRLAADKYGGRWLLDNPHRQQLRRGEPVMTQVMRGDFYESATPSAAAPHGPQRRTRSATIDAQRQNRHDVRVASAVNAAVRRAQSSHRQSRGGCYCAAASKA